MATQRITNIANDGVELYTVTSDPNGVILAASGSVALRTDNGNVGIFINNDDLTAWSKVPMIDATGDLDLVGVDQILIRDNNVAALAIGSTGKLNLLVFDTLNGAEQVEYNGVLPFLINTGGLTVTAGTVTLPEASLNVASATTDAATGVVTAALLLPVVYGVGNTDTVLPARVGGWRVVDAYIIGGGAGGNVTVQTGAGVGISNAMVPGGAAGDVTRATNINLTNGLIASGGTVRVAGAAGTVAGTCFIRIEPR
jgi:hypothetical protein